jgi:hypothetical protein
MLTNHFNYSFFNMLVEEKFKHLQREQCRG